MPEIGFTDGNVVTAANLNQIEDQIIVTCTSTTRPTGVEGRHIWETDNGRLLVYDGAAWQEQNGLWAQVTSGATAGTNWTITSLNAFVNTRMLSFVLVASRTTSAVTNTGSGDIGNQTIATLPTSLRGNVNESWAVTSSVTGRLCGGSYNPSTGVLTLGAIGGTTNIAISEEISLGGFVLINT